MRIGYFYQKGTLGNPKCLIKLMFKQTNMTQSPDASDLKLLNSLILWLCGTILHHHHCIHWFAIKYKAHGWLSSAIVSCCRPAIIRWILMLLLISEPCRYPTAWMVSGVYAILWVRHHLSFSCLAAFLGSSHFRPKFCFSAYTWGLDIALVQSCYHSGQGGMIRVISIGR